MSESVRRIIVREFLAEMAGTFLLVAFGNGSVASASLYIPDGVMANFFLINIGYGLGLFMAVLVAGKVSGAHVNPAVTVALACVGKIEPWKVGHYMVAQYLGAFLSSPFVFVIYLFAIMRDKLSLDERFWDFYYLEKAGIFATYTSAPLIVGFLVETLISALLLFGVMAMIDKQNINLPVYLYPLTTFMILTAIGLCFGPVTGYAINPARDFSPRLFSWLVGFGSQVWEKNDYYFWVPVIAPHVGAIVGAGLYKCLIESHLRHRTKQQEFSVVSAESAISLDVTSFSLDSPGSNSKTFKATHKHKKPKKYVHAYKTKLK